MIISIVIPTRNEIKTIAQTMEQYLPYLDQFNLEIIISDANSTDGTAAVVRQIAGQYDKRIRLVQPQGKQNIAIGRNAGGRAANGDILFHTDADVRLPNPEQFFQTIQNNFSDPSLVAFTTPIRIYPEENCFKDRAFHGFMNAVIRVSMLAGWCWAKGESQIMRKAAFLEIGGYNESLVAGEDCDLFYRLNKIGQVKYVPEIEVHHSPRRFRQYGYLGVSYQYFMEGISRFFANKSYASEWKVVR